MSRSVLSSLLGVILVVGWGQGLLPPLNNLHTKFEYTHSFKGPHILDAQGNIPFWKHGGSAIASDDYLRVCPSVRSHKGWAWNTKSFTHANWYVDISLRVTGRLKTGADGMAIWVTESPGEEGPVYGSSDRWKGIGLFLDSFDNDGRGDNPNIQLVLNDGSFYYDHRSDGNQQQSGSCTKDFRNRPYEVRVRLSYLRNVLEVWVHDGISPAEDNYELCMTVENDPKLSSIPETKYFGVSAATGGLSDDHDVTKFLTFSAQTFEERATKKLMEDDDAFKELNDKYNQMAGDFEQRRETYVKEHPDVPAASKSWQEVAPEGNMDWQKRLELEQSVQMVADLQGALQREIRSLSSKMDLLLQRDFGDTGGHRDTRDTGGAIAGNMAAEITSIKNTESNILHQLADLRAAMDRTVPEGGKATASEQMQPVYEMKNMMGQQGQDLQAILQQLQSLNGKQCPTPEVPLISCLSPWLFVTVIVIQVLVFMGYSLYTQAQERKAKKFF